jgi:methylmalonyl-CoA mutase cobalamin-binding domain/chain
MDALCITRAEAPAQLHRGFLEAGCDVVETNTFQASRLRLSEWGLADQTLDINRAGAAIARRECDVFEQRDGRPRFVAGAIGPSGFLPSSDDPTLSNVRFERLVEVFAEQTQGLLEGGADLLIVETQQDILETKAVMHGARRAFASVGRSVPIQVQVSLDPNGRMLLGTDVGATLSILEGLDADVIGLNCSTGPELMREPIRYLVQNSSRPISVIPNAGIPINLGGGKAHYPLDPVGLADALEEFVREFGVNVVGGCCGTTFEHLRAVVERVGGHAPRPRIVIPAVPRAASSIRAFDLRQDPPPTLIGERVNTQGSRKVKRLLLGDDYEGVLSVARDQMDGGAHLLDVCVALTERGDESHQMVEVVKRLRSSVEAPLVIDSTEREVLSAALDAYPGRPILNSFNLEGGRDKADFVLGLAKQHGAFVVAMTIDEEGMAHTAERKVEIARRIHELACGEHGLAPESLIFDVLTFPVTTGQEDLRDDAHQTIEGIRRVKAELPGVLTLLGLSNVSFGISPAARGVLNSAFLFHCVEAGLDLAIVNPVHLTPYAEVDAEHRALAEDLIYNRREDALPRFLAAFEGVDVQPQRGGAEDEDADLPVDERIHGRILHRKKEGIEALLDQAIGQRLAPSGDESSSSPSTADAPSADASAGDTPRVDTSTSVAPAADASAGDTPRVDTSTSVAPAADASAGDTPTSDTSALEAPSADASAGDTPTSATSAVGVSSSGVAAPDASAGDTPTSATSTSGAPAADASAGDTPTSATSTSGVAAADASAGDTPTSATSTSGAPAAGASAGDTPTSATSAVGVSSSGVAAADASAGDTPTSATSTSGAPAAGASAGDTQTSATSTSGVAAADAAAGDTPTSDTSTVGAPLAGGLISPGQAAVAVLNDVLLPAMKDVGDRFGAGELILPFVLQSAEVMKRAVSHLEQYLEKQAGYSKGSIVVATVYGDVHDIGKSLLITILSNNGYTVHDLGKQVPVNTIVEAAIDKQADAIGLSALLVSTSKQMPLCIQELDRRGIHLPVLIGGAAINRAFGRRAAVMPDGRIYEPAVFYCKDVFEGLSTMDALTDPQQLPALVEQVRSEIAAERDKVAEPAPVARVTPRPGAGPRRDVHVPTPPFWGARRMSADLRQVWQHLDRNTLFRHHWGGHRAKGPEYERIIAEVFEPELSSLTAAALQDGWLEPLIVSGYFPANASGDELVIFDPVDQDREVTRLQFPRQSDGERLCLADYFRPLDTGQRDVVAFQAVSAGPRAGAYVEELQQSGDYSRMLYVNGLASGTAEALAEYAHNLARTDLALPDGQGLRFSWGYPACPDLAEQRKVLPLLHSEEEIGLTLSLSNNLDPEHSTAAIILHHPEAKYFAVRTAA